MMNNNPIPERAAPAGRLLIVNMGRLGDTILRNSILDSAFRTFATVDYLCGEHNAELIRHDGRFNKVTVLRNTPAGFASVLKMAARRYDALIDLKGHPSSTSILLGMLSRSRVKTGCNRGWLRPFHHEVGLAGSRSEHVLQTMRRIAERAGLATGEFKPSLFLPPEPAAWFQKNHATLGRPFIFINISATTCDRTWPVEHWARYVASCHLAGRSILINGLPEDREQARKLAEKLPGSVVFQPRHFMDVVAAIQAAALVLTVETGVVHVCSAFNKPIVAFFCVGKNADAYEPLSTWQLMIHPRTGCNVCDIDPEDAIEKTKSCDLASLLNTAEVEEKTSFKGVLS